MFETVILCCVGILSGISVYANEETPYAPWTPEKSTFVTNAYTNTVEIIRTRTDISKEEQDQALQDTLLQYQICTVHRDYLSNTSFTRETLLRERQLMINYTSAFTEALGKAGIINARTAEQQLNSQAPGWYNEFDQMNKARAKGTEAEKKQADEKWWTSYRICNTILEGFQMIDRQFENQPGL